MADQTLHAKIVLDGGKEAVQQLTAISQSGKDAFAQTQQAAQRTTSALSNVSNEISSLVSGFRAAVAQISSSGSLLGAAFNPLISATQRAFDAVARTGIGFGVIAGASYAVTASIASIGQQAANSAAKLDDAAEAIGLTTEKYRGLQAALKGVGIEANTLEQMAGVIERGARKQELSGPAAKRVLSPLPSENDREGGGNEAPASGEIDSSALEVTLSAKQMAASVRANEIVLNNAGAAADGLATKNKNLAESFLGASSEAVKLPIVINGLSATTLQQVGAIGAFNRVAAELGVALVNGEGKSRKFIDVARDFTFVFSKMADDAKRTQYAVDAFGESLAKNVLAIADSGKAIGATDLAVERSGAIRSEEQKKAAADARQTGAAVEAVTTSWREYFAQLAVPVAIDRNNAILGFFERNREAIKGFADEVAGPAIQWLGRLDHALGLSAIAAAGLGSAFGLIGSGAALGLGGAGVALTLFGTNLKDAALNAMGGLREIVSRFDLKTFAGWSSAAKAAFDSIADYGKSAIVGMRDYIASIDWMQTWQTFLSISQSAFDAVTSIAREAYETIKASAISAFPALAETWGRLEGIVKSVFDNIKGFSNSTWVAIGAGLLAAVIVWRTGFLGLGATVALFWTEILAGATRFAPALARVMGPFGAMLTSFWRALAATSQEGAAGAAARAGAFSELRASAIAVWAEVRAIFANGARSLRTVIAEAFPESEAIFSGIASAARGVWSALKIMAAEFAGVLYIITGGQVKLSALEASFLIIGLRVTGLLPLLSSMLSFAGFAINGTAIFIAALPTLFGMLASGIARTVGMIGAISSGIVTAVEFIAVAFSRAAMASLAFAIANPVIAGVIAALVLLGVALYEIYTHWDQIKAGASAAWDSVQATTLAAWAAIKAAPGDFFDWLDAKWEAFKASIADVWKGLQDGAKSAWDGVKNTFDEAIKWIEAKWDTFIAKVKAGLGITGEAGLNGGSPDQASPAPAAGYASGGLISGPGSGTSDSILSRLSNGEFVVSARAVAAYGADLFHAFNSMQVPGFAGGGLLDLSGLAPVPVPLPRAANTNSASAGRIAFDLDIGGRSFEGLSAPRETVAELQRHAALRQIGAASKRRPGWDR